MQNRSPIVQMAIPVEPASTTPSDPCGNVSSGYSSGSEILLATALAVSIVIKAITPLAREMLRLLRAR